MKQNRHAPPACIWMQAGVVKKKPCFKEFHCHECRFDRAMVRVCRSSTGSSGTGRFTFWQEKLRQRPASARPCIHHMKGRIAFRACHRSYRCADCEFDQFFQDRFRVSARITPMVFDRVRGFDLPAGYYLSPAHVWVRIEGNGMVSIGVDDFICRLLGKFDRAVLPLMGKVLEKDRKGFTLERKGKQAVFPSPVTGVVTGVNPDTVKHPLKIPQAPYTDGWLFTLVCDDLKKQIKSLMFMESARAFTAGAAGNLYAYLESYTGLAAADGGELTPDLAAALPPGAWTDLVSRFIPAPAGLTDRQPQTGH